MNRFTFYLNKLLGKSSVAKFTLLGTPVTLGIVAMRELRRAREIEIESELIDHMRPILKTGDTVFDIGANIGLISIIMAKSADSGGENTSKTGLQFYAFEPEPRNFKQLQNNIKLNGLETFIHPHQLALGAEEGEVELHIRGSEGEGRHSIASSKGATDAIRVQIQTMSQFCQEHNVSPNVIKIDVEGAEGQVLAGMQAMLQTKAPEHVFMEIHPKGDGEMMPSGETIGQWMEQNGYSLEWSNLRGSGEHRHYRFASGGK